MYEDLKTFVDGNVEDDQGRPICVFLSGASYCDKTYEIIRSKSRCYVIEYVIDGCGYIEFEGQTHKVSKDMIYILPAGVRHHYYADAEQPFVKIFLNVGGTAVKYLVDSFDLSKGVVFEGEGLKEIFERIPQMMHSDMDDQAMQSQFCGIFVEILSRLSSKKIVSSYSREAIILKSYLDQNVRSIVSAKDLSDLIFRSPDYCQKLFNREIGMTPYSYQLNNKMKIAKYLISDTNMTISEIAEYIGYSDTHYFSNIFKKKCGFRPMSYRKMKRSE